MQQSIASIDNMNKLIFMMSIIAIGADEAYRLKSHFHFVD